MIIYLIKNKINGKKYVGQHCGDSDTRWQQHLRESLNMSNNKPLYSAMRKYGTENFTYSVLEEVPLELGQRELDLREIFHIHDQNSYISNGEGYNLTLGGGGAMVSFCSTKVTGKKPDKYDWGQYDKEGNLIKVWENVQDAAKEHGVNYHHIHHASDWHIGKGKYGKTSGGYMWLRIPNNSEAPNKIKSFKELGTKKAKKLTKRKLSKGAGSNDYEISQYDMNGNLIQIWPNNAEHIFRVGNYDSDSVKSNIRGESVFTYGYMWRRFKKGESPKKIEAPKDLTGVNIDYNNFYQQPIYEKDVNGNYTKRINSVSDIKKPFMSQIKIYDNIFNKKNYSNYIPEYEITESLT